MKKSIWGFLVLLLPLHLALAQNEQLVEKFQENFKRPYLSLGFLQQTVGDYQRERSGGEYNGFTIANFRVLLAGEFDQGFGYFLQANFISYPAMLDAKIYYRHSPAFAIEAGLFKVPFSAEFLIVAANIYFVNRARVVSLLAPGRQIGAQISGSLLNGQLGYQAGVFNGNAGRDNRNDDQNLLSAARFLWKPNLGEKHYAEVGVNVAGGKESHMPLRMDFLSGTRNLLGADFRWQSERLLLSGEWISAKLKDKSGWEAAPNGYQLTGGVKITPKTQVLVRLDHLDGDMIFFEKSDQIWFGFNLWPTSVSEVQVNYIIDSEQREWKYHHVLINFQISI